MMDSMLTDAVEQLFRDRCTPRVVREIEGGGPTAALWAAIQEGGFADALVAEEHGGVGLGLHEAQPIIEACGRHALPLPLAQTMMARAVLTADGVAAPEGSIALARLHGAGADGPLLCRGVAYGAVADWVLVDLGAELALLPTAAAAAEKTRRGHHSVDADLRWTGRDAAAARLRPATPPDWRAAEAALYAAQLAGAMDSVFRSALNHANERTQFGRSVGKFQAIQHHLSVMAEQVAAARMAARMGCGSAGPLPDPMLAALAKARTSEAAVVVASLGHAVHGAIGITEEFDLQLHTRRLHAWRLAGGSESYWNRRLGEALVHGTDGPVLDFIRTALSPRAPDTNGM